MTALAGATEIDLVVTGKHTVLSIGRITTEVMITIAGNNFQFFSFIFLYFYIYIESKIKHITY